MWRADWESFLLLGPHRYLGRIIMESKWQGEGVIAMFTCEAWYPHDGVNWSMRHDCSARAIFELLAFVWSLASEGFNQKSQGTIFA